MSKNPYADLPDFAFWRRSMSGRTPLDVDPVRPPPFKIARNDLVATAGSCFAQHISRTLVGLDFSYLVTEKAPNGYGGENYGVFPARFGNIYTVRQLLQLFNRAYGLIEPVDSMWQREDMRWVDPFRPRIDGAGFSSPDELLSDRERHFAAVREMFETCDVFIFTLGLTEAWISVEDGSVFPIARGVVAAVEDAGRYFFHNFTVSEVEADLLAFLDQLRTVNPLSRVVLTISPVALVATYEPQHVLTSTTYSKSVLRVAAETATRSRANVAYFPSYEIIVGPHSRGTFFEDDLREVRPEAVEYVMSLFTRHYLSGEPSNGDNGVIEISRPVSDEELARIRMTEGVICDEQILDQP